MFIRSFYYFDTNNFMNLATFKSVMDIQLYWKLLHCKFKSAIITGNYW